MSVDKKLAPVYQDVINAHIAGDKAAMSTAMKQIIAQKTASIMTVTESLTSTSYYSHGPMEAAVFEGFDFNVTLNNNGKLLHLEPISAEVKISATPSEPMTFNDPGASGQVEDFTITKLIVQELNDEGDPIGQPNTLIGDAIKPVVYGNPQWDELLSAISNSIAVHFSNMSGPFASGESDY